ncbi:zinc finger protein GAI-ASSOCIATED FACTOR 1-like [Oryza brachyantha]|uniref:zinc finger protein GAI-ASSOCIATED FACTOR 1-like n=1 Tax=Oryza brachyantha TaxID=4533 RepID=UPI001ADB54B4|nr:zinc finger protein GAI-ASSOCIATED FACTOR 1-like [Oryza brachyantha]
MEEFEMHHQQQQQSCYSKLLLGSPLVEIANVDDGELQRFAGATSEPPPAGSPAVKKKKRSLPGTPDPSAEVVALSPRTLLATNRFVCEICGKGFQRDQNLQLHRRGHNLPWKLRQRGAGGAGGEPLRKRVYVCPEPSCVHHSPSRALGDLTGIKKHFCRKHGEKKWKCERCGKRYAVHSDWKAHSKVCGTREYKCDCGTVFSRRDSFVTHRAFCDALAQENNKLAQPMNMATVTSALQGQAAHHLVLPSQPDDAVAEDDDAAAAGYGIDADVKSPHLKMFPDDNTTVAVGNPLLPALSMAGCMLSSLGGRAATPFSPFFHGGKPGMERPGDAALGFPPPAPGSAAIMSATALLQKAAELGATTSASCYGGVGFPTVGIGSAVVGGGGLDRLPALGHNLGPFDVVPAATTTTTTQLVGFDLGGMLPGQLYGGGGAMTRAIGSLMHGEQHVGMMDRRRRGEGVRVVDYMGVDDDDDQRSFDGVGLFGPRIGPWA